MPQRSTATRIKVSLVCFAVLTWLDSGPPAAAQGTLVEVGERGPGMHPQVAADLELGVPRTFELTHVDPEHVAAALGHDPVRIFQFVRDAVAFESYDGILRGPRGTLLALAGNAVDRAALLGSLLEYAGQEVRYARGTLAEREASELVASMWAVRPEPAWADGDGEPPAVLQQALRTLEAAVDRDYALILDQLAAAGVTPGPEAAWPLETLVRETQDHYWVLWLDRGSWVDLDPSFADALPGQTFATVEESFDSLPEALYHQVELRIVLEEYTDDVPATREILRFGARAADLSGRDVALVHMPERWQGPVEGLDGAISAALEDTGHIVPVLVVEDEVIRGEPFRPAPPATTGLGGIGNLLGGIGTRNPVPIATMESIEFEFRGPDGRAETVVRELYDLVGPSRREMGAGLSPDEVRALTEAEDRFDISAMIYHLLFVTGPIDAVHLLQLAEDSLPEDSLPEDDDDVDLLAILRHFNLALAAVSGASLQRVDPPDALAVRFYPDSPRLLISELSIDAEMPRMSVDLRRDRARAVAIGPQPENVFYARVFRGVVNGTLERVLMEVATAELRGVGMAPVMSTSSLFDEVESAKVSLATLPAEEASLDPGIADDARARLRAEAAAGRLAIAPRAAVALNGTPRFAWWRVDPVTGETVAVTDEGLHQTSADMTIQYNRTKTRAVVTVRQYVGTGADRMLVESRSVLYQRNAAGVLSDGVSYLSRDIGFLLRAGVRIRPVR